MYDLRPNLEPGNPDGHTVLRYLVETKQMPLETAIERVIHAVAKYAQQFRSDQNKLLTGMVVTGVLGLPVFFPFGISSLLIVGAVGASAARWQELGTMRSRLKPEYAALKGSVLLEQFIKWLAQELKERRGQAANSGEFQPDAIATANILAAYEHTVEAITNGEHLENNASDPILALFILKLRQHTNHLPDWILQAFRQLEQAEVQRANDVERASQYMWGNLEERYPTRFNQPPTGEVGQNTRLDAVDVPAQPVPGEGEQRLGKLIETNYPALPLENIIQQEQQFQKQSSPPRPQTLMSLPLKQRALAIIEHLERDGFDLSRAIGEQITCICGNQRGGKGTLMAILAVLASAIDPSTKIHYFSAGDDIYPFRCHRLVCRLNFPKLDGTDADRLVAGELYRYLKTMDNATQGQYSDIILVIDEAVALSDYLDPDQKQWIIRFLLTRANKKGAQIFIVLHGSNLTSWVGTGNTSGFSHTFKTGVTFIGCEATSKKLSPLRSISVATGHYFIASSDDFSKSVEAGELGTIPSWLKTETNPSTGQPDPVRTLLQFFPELCSQNRIADIPANEPNGSQPLNEQQKWDRFVLEATDEQINELIDKMRSQPVPQEHEAFSESKPNKPLSESERKLIEFAKEKSNDWLAPSWFTNNKEYFKTWKSEQVIELFHQVKEKGYGDTLCSNGTVKFRLENPES